MKRFALMISLLLSILCMTQAKDRIVERPPFLAQSSSSIEIDKIVMSDTVTTVYIKAFYRPKYWIKIATGSVLKDNNGNLYPCPEGNRHYTGQRVLDARIRRSRIPINFPTHSSKRDLPGFL